MTETVMVDKTEEQKGLSARSDRDNPGLHATEAQVLAFERRRAGRLDVSPILVPLLRDPASFGHGLEQASIEETPFRDYLDSDPFQGPLAPARGIVIGLALSMLFWGFIGYMIFR